MSRPRTPSERHPEYPRYAANMGEALIAFYLAHPEFKDEGEYEFLCEFCGGSVDDDICFCPRCKEHAGTWQLIGPDGELMEEHA